MRPVVLFLALLAALALASWSLPALAQSCSKYEACPRAGKECCPNTYGGGSSCVNLIRADDHCGECGYQCGQHYADAGRRCCGKLVYGKPVRNCVDTQGDVENCGGCDKKCPTHPVAYGQHVCKKGECAVACHAGFVYDAYAYKCVACPDKHEIYAGKCVPECPYGFVRDHAGKCVCPYKYEIYDGKCVSECLYGFVRNGAGKCVCPATFVPDHAGTKCVCPYKYEVYGGKCVPSKH